MSATLRTTSQENAALALALHDCYNTRDFDRSATMVADDAEITIVPFGVAFRGRDGMREFQRGWATAFPDSRTDVRTVTATDERVVVEFIARGTHGGLLLTPAGAIAPTGRRIEVPFCDVFEVRDGVLTRGSTYFDAATMMSQLGQTLGSSGESSNVALARRWFDTMNSGELEAVAAIFAPTYRLHYPDIDTQAVGPDVIRGLVAAYREAFPDLHFNVEDVVGSGDTVVVRWTASGTNSGSLLGAPATGRFARWSGMSVLRMQGGRIVEDWVENDRLGMLHQLGLAPASEVHAVA